MCAWRSRAGDLSFLVFCSELRRPSSRCRRRKSKPGGVGLQRLLVCGSPMCMRKAASRVGKADTSRIAGIVLARQFTSRRPLHFLAFAQVQATERHRESSPPLPCSLPPSPPLPPGCKTDFEVCTRETRCVYSGLSIEKTGKVTAGGAPVIAGGGGSSRRHQQLFL